MKKIIFQLSLLVLGIVVICIITFNITKLTVKFINNNFNIVKKILVLATTKVPESFTELYFENHNDLPKRIEQYKFYNFVFTVRNLENRTIDYDYVVYLETVDRKVLLDRNKITLKHGEKISLYEEFGPLLNIDMKFTVELTNKNNQSIHFYMKKI